MSSSNVVFVCEEVECSILNKYYLFQNGRLLLTCIVLLSPTDGWLKLILQRDFSQANERQRHLKEKLVSEFA